MKLSAVFVLSSSCFFLRDFINIILSKERITDNISAEIFKALYSQGLPTGILNNLRRIST